MAFEHTVSLHSEEEWLIRQASYDHKLNQYHETIFTLSNGYMGTRGSLEEGSEHDHPGNFIAGVFDKSEANVKELVNTPNWLGAGVYLDGKPIGADNCEIVEFQRALDMKKGLLFRCSVLKDAGGRITAIETCRLVSRSNIHRAGMEIHITPVNYSGTITVESSVEGGVINIQAVPRLEIKHLQAVENTGLNPRGCYLQMATRDDGTNIGIGMHTLIKNSDGSQPLKSRTVVSKGEYMAEKLEIEAMAGKSIKLHKLVCTFTSRNISIDKLLETVNKELDCFIDDTFENELFRHVEAYEKLWNVADIQIAGDDSANKALRFNIFHLMSMANKEDPYVSLAAKGLHGEGYKGHVFWDTEIFMLPFFVFAYPEAARALMAYRYNMLEGARAKALQNGFKGAQFPWESADSGCEECPDQAIDFSGEIIDVLTAKMEHHITADVAYALCHYYSATGDIEFMSNCGLEMMICTARFWASRCEYCRGKDRYEINDVIGPDEFHEGVDNNAYTNYMAKWNMKKAVELLGFFRENHKEIYCNVASKLQISETEIRGWNEVADKLYTPFDRKTKLIEQFEGYFNKKDCIISRHDENNMPLWPENADLLNLSGTSLVKQADVVLLLMLLREEFDVESIKTNYEYYDKRTMQKSSLSPGIYSITGLMSGDATKAYAYFLRTANTDLMDNQGNTAHGIHAAALGGTWQGAVFGFAGVHIDKGGYLSINPQLPKEWNEIGFKLFWKGNIIQVRAGRKYTDIQILDGEADELPVKLNGRLIKMKKHIAK